MSSSRNSRIPAPNSPTIRHAASSKALRVPASPLISRSSSPTKSATARPRTKSSVAPAKVKEPPKPKENISIRDAIALKRAEARKAKSKPPTPVDSLEDAIPDAVPPEEPDLLGRKPIRETIENSKSTGSLNLCAREPPLLCIPSALFEIVLGITPEKLDLVPSEPELPPPSPLKANSRAPAWYEAQDLVILKASNNEIRQIQPEINLFGSLKTLDLHFNKLESLPESFTDLVNLSILDLSHNSLRHLPDKIWSLPELSYLNVSFNLLTTLDFGAPFRSGANRTATTPTTDFFVPQIERSKEPCPRLVTLEARANKLIAQSIGHPLPISLSKLDLSENPIENDPSEVHSLLKRFSELPKLKDLRFERADISGASFPADLLAALPAPFPALQLLDLGETKVSRRAAEEAVSTVERELRWVGPSEDLRPDSIRVVIGKKDLREPWEIEVEERAQRNGRRAHPEVISQAPFAVDHQPVAAAKSPEPPSPPPPQTPPAVEKQEIVKETWEIEAEQGLLTEGGRRRARAAAAQAEEERKAKEKAETEQDAPSLATRIYTLLSSPQYYAASNHALTLPPATATKMVAKQHARAFSFAATSSYPVTDLDKDVVLPPQTLPLHLISALDCAPTLKTLICNSRRKDKTFVLPSTQQQLELPEQRLHLPHLLDLELEGCQLPDHVSVSYSADSNAVATAQGTKPLLSLITVLFPSLTTVNLSHNMITSDSLTADVVAALVLAGGGGQSLRPGLRSLSLRGNRIDGLEGFEALAAKFKGNRQVNEYKLEELDLRENEISKLPPILGLLPLDVFLVEGNIFRVPQRRIWEREGSRGLLNWLRGRIE